jgi:hypothetical protein
VLPRQLEHARGDVERAQGRGAAREHSRKPSDPAADLDHVVARADARPDRAEQGVELALALAPEALGVRAAVVERVVDEQHRVLIRGPVPDLAHAHGVDSPR